jgi:predicted kinase
VARRLGRPAAAIVFDLPLVTCLQRNELRTDRRVPPAAIRRQHAHMRESLEALAGEGFDPLAVLATLEEVEAVRVELAAR